MSGLFQWVEFSEESVQIPLWSVEFLPWIIITFDRNPQILTFPHSKARVLQVNFFRWKRRGTMHSGRWVFCPWDLLGENPHQTCKWSLPHICEETIFSRWAWICLALCAPLAPKKLRPESETWRIKSLKMHSGTSLLHKSWHWIILHSKGSDERGTLQSLVGVDFCRMGNSPDGKNARSGGAGTHRKQG